MWFKLLHCIVCRDYSFQYASRWFLLILLITHRLSKVFTFSHWIRKTSRGGIFSSWQKLTDRHGRRLNIYHRASHPTYIMIIIMLILKTLQMSIIIIYRHRELCLSLQFTGYVAGEGGREGGFTRLAADGKLGRILLECLYGGLTRMLDVLNSSVDRHVVPRGLNKRKEIFQTWALRCCSPSHCRPPCWRPGRGGARWWREVAGGARAQRAAGLQPGQCCYGPGCEPVGCDPSAAASAEGRGPAPEQIFLISSHHPQQPFKAHL